MHKFLTATGISGGLNCFITISTAQAQFLGRRVLRHVVVLPLRAWKEQGVERQFLCQDGSRPQSWHQTRAALLLTSCVTLGIFLNLSERTPVLTECDSPADVCKQMRCEMTSVCKLLSTMAGLQRVLRPRFNSTVLPKIAPLGCLANAHAPRRPWTQRRASIQRSSVL